MTTASTTARPQAAARAALGLPADAFIVGYAGLTFAYRRLDLLLDAFAALRDAAGGGPRRLLLVLAGGRPAELGGATRAGRRPGDLPLSLDSRRGTLEIQSAPAALLLPGQVGQPDVVRYLYAADVLVIPDTVTTLTASPLKLFEYMAAGRPIVLRELPALREILGDAGLYFPARRRRGPGRRAGAPGPRPGAGRAAGRRRGGPRRAVHLSRSAPAGCCDTLRAVAGDRR